MRSGLAGLQAQMCTEFIGVCGQGDGMAAGIEQVTSVLDTQSAGRRTGLAGFAVSEACLGSLCRRRSSSQGKGASLASASA